MTTTTAELTRRYNSEYNEAISRADTERAVALNRARDRGMQELARFLGITDYDPSATAATAAMGATTLADPAAVMSARRASGVARAWENMSIDELRALSPEALLMYAEHQSHVIDTNVNSLLADMQETSRRSAALRAVSDRINQWANTNHENTATIDLNEQMVELENPDGTTTQVSLRVALERAGHRFGASDSMTWRRSDMQGLRDLVQQRGQALTEGSEQRSLKLQNLMSQRSQLFQLVTQMLMGMSEASKGIAGNIGR